MSGHDGEHFTTGSSVKVSMDRSFLDFKMFPIEGFFFFFPTI